ncbi:unnamed protein product [Prorocentrum cordatum]|uniref:GST N-terminal domain-containing protein n=1 Tax=Prorocentrum cordatum TaxID=2364126 RepID=A0ABN9SW91_9DINO|nr:unnamed protein product [Polarella glacialis]|mmetsp:Transcript_27964/g.74813  ORF Transcript_27964/g.74813 Transcript_27964/m.74813 type:complete len:180 (-) Transcript_27964:124-663(-)
MPMKLYAHPANYKTHKALIAAKYVGLEVETPAGAAAAQTGKIPVLETPQGCIFSSAAIARYISRINRQVALYGQNLLEGGMIDSWIEFCTHELEVPLCTWVLPKMGVFEEVPEATACAKEDVKRALTVLNNHLLHNTYMVGGVRGPRLCFPRFFEVALPRDAFQRLRFAESVPGLPRSS